MNLISCKKCGAVLDKNYLRIPGVYDDNGDYIEGNSEWDGEDYRPLITCPVCKKTFLEED